MDTELDRRLELARTEVAKKLSSMFKTWTVIGDTVIGPGTLAVRVEDQHRLGPSHFDLGFVLNRESAEAPILWDCTAGLGAMETDVVKTAVENWASCTAPAILELLKQDGSFASHLGYDDPRGCPGWHVIHGPVTAFGKGTAPKELQAWALEIPLLPVLGPMVASAFERPMLNGVKLLFGFAAGEIAEVKVNGVTNEAATQRLRSMNWPRSAEGAFVRCYWLFVHQRSN